MCLLVRKMPRRQQSIGENNSSHEGNAGDSNPRGVPRSNTQPGGNNSSGDSNENKPSGSESDLSKSIYVMYQIIF